MDDLVSMLPIMDSALKAIEVAERRELVLRFIAFVKETSEQLNKYASSGNSGEPVLLRRLTCLILNYIWPSIPIEELVQLE
jgi:hypothetical protein